MEARATFRRMVLFLVSLGLAALACNAPLGNESTPPTEESRPATAEPTQTMAAPQTLSPSLSTATPSESEPESQPTFTPIPLPTVRPSDTPTATPRATNTPRPSSGGTGRATATSESTGPLTIDYRISWRLKADNALISIATMTVEARGGSGEYRYYRDDIEVDGPVFEYEWASCKGNPGTLRVDSSDGQSATVKFFGTPLCPTMTPTPNP